MSSSAIDVFGNQVDNFKNKIINGNFDFWQRLRGLEGSSFAITNSTSDITAFVPDRWFLTTDMSGSDSFSASIEQKSHPTSQSEILSLPKYYTRFSGVVTENSTGNNTQCGFAQRIEGVRTLAGKQVTVSFWVRGSTSGFASFRVSQKFGSGGSPTAQVNVGQRDFAIAENAWTKVIFTFSMPSIASGAVIGNRLDDAVEVAFQTYCSKDFLKASSKVNYTGTLDISQVQVEEGAQATLFDKRMPQVELDMCQRYFEVGFVNDTEYAKGTSSATDRTNFKFITYKTKKKTYDVASGATWVPDPDLVWDNLVNSTDTFSPGDFETTDINPDTVGHTVKHSIAGIDTVPDGSSEIRSGIISETQPEGFVVNYNANGQPFGLVNLKGQWAVDAEIYQGETPT